ncbi:MAG: hypothetical protein IPL86_17120 [Flavobacteriales bacterium]|nr:hypothetical protein [Flavobacteriales bacterium]
MVLTEVSSGKAADEQLQQDLFDVLAECDAVLLAMDAGQRDLFWRIREHCNPASKQHFGDRGVFFDNCVPVQLVGTSKRTNGIFTRTFSAGNGTRRDRDLQLRAQRGRQRTPRGATANATASKPTSASTLTHRRRDRKSHGGVGRQSAAEHNIGVKTQRLRYADPAAMELVKRIKAVVDPAGVMNPGRGLV